MTTLLSLLRNMVPSFVISWYHYLLAHIAAFIYRFPSHKLFVIGVTGTNGKSTTANLIADILTEAGYKVALSSTVNLRIGASDSLNTSKMTMPGRFALQKFLRQALNDHCQYAVVETSSEGIKQYRHAAINYDLVVFTNLTPEHIESHGSFENYKRAKEQLFIHIGRSKRKQLDGVRILKRAVYNLDDEHVADFIRHPVDIAWGFSLSPDIQPSEHISADHMVIARNISLTAAGSRFDVSGHRFSLRLLGRFNVANALAAVAATHALGIDFAIAERALQKRDVVPGRMEFIEQGQPFKVLIDYAPEPTAMKMLFATLPLFSFDRLIHVLGSAGGGRDTARRSVLGRMSGERADTVIVTNEDPYDENPQLIIEQVAGGAVEAGKKRDHNLFTFLDRKEAISQALHQAHKNDLVLITGKGAEQAMVGPSGQKNPWDDRQVVREILIAMGFSVSSSDTEE